MHLFKFGPTTIAEWQALVIEAQNESGYDFDESLESYLVLTLDHFTTDDGLASSIIALDYLNALDISGKLGKDLLRNIGDQCLLLSGLFPERALKRNVPLGYYIGMGQQAYQHVATVNPQFEFDTELFNKLSFNFIGLMDVLHAMRQMPFRKFQ